MPRCKNEITCWISGNVSCAGVGSGVGSLTTSCPGFGRDGIGACGVSGPLDRRAPGRLGAGHIALQSRCTVTAVSCLILPTA
eukprot:3251747-Prorocentrum_lima.AAC.1